MTGLMAIFEGRPIITEQELEAADQNRERAERELEQAIIEHDLIIEKYLRTF